MPAPSAEVVLPVASGWPSISIEPRSADSAPAMILMRVDLPAPFSPTIACTSPACRSRFTPRSACTPPYRFSTPLSRRTDGPPDVCAVSPPGWVVVMGLLREGRAAGSPGGPTDASVGELVDVLGCDPQCRPEQEGLGGRVVAGVRHDLLQGSVRVERLVGGQLVAGPRGQVAELLDVPQDRRAGRAVGQVRLHGLRRAEAVGEHLANLAALLDRLGHCGRR